MSNSSTRHLRVGNKYSKAHLRTRSKEELINLYYATDFQRRAAWREYYEESDRRYDMQVALFHLAQCCDIGTLSQTSNHPEVVGRLNTALLSIEDEITCRVCDTIMTAAKGTKLLRCKHRVCKACYPEIRETGCGCSSE